MSKFKVRDKLATRSGLTEYVVEKVHEDGSLTVVEDWLPAGLLRFARRYRVASDALVSNLRITLSDAA